MSDLQLIFFFEKIYLFFIFRAGIERKVPDKVTRRFDKALEILEVSPGERKLIKPFTVCILFNFWLHRTWMVSIFELILLAVVS